MYKSIYPPLPDEYLREIGQITVLWNRLEGLLHFALIGALLGHYPQGDGRAHSVFVHMAFPQKLDVLSSMLRFREERLLKRYVEILLPLLKACQEKRNAMVHQDWENRPEGVIRLGRKARGIYKTEAWVIDLSDLQEVSALLESTCSKTYAFNRSLVFQAKTSHNKGSS